MSLNKFDKPLTALIVVILLIVYAASSRRPALESDIIQQRILAAEASIDQNAAAKERRELGRKHFDCLRENKPDYCEYLLPIGHKVGEPW